MNIDYLLKKEGITNIKELDISKIKVISKDLAIKLCLAFPEHDLDRQVLYNSFCALNMYTCTMPKDSSGAKYFTGYNSIYFNENLDFYKLPEIAMHECIHFLQENTYCDEKSEKPYSFLALNEAAVQLMASEANMSNMVEEKYFDISFKTISPNYYPLECVLLNQIMYFTGSYPLYHSILNNTNLFRNTFITKFNKKFYNKFANQLDKLLKLEEDLNCYINELETTDNITHLKQLNKIIVEQKHSIKKMFFDIQNYIMKNCFFSELNKINTIKDLKSLKTKLYNFKNLIGTSDDYTFYNDFYCNFMNALEIKKEQLHKYGEINLFKQECTALTIINNSKESINLFHIFSTKFKNLFKFRKDTINEYKI